MTNLLIGIAITIYSQFTYKVIKAEIRQTKREQVNNQINEALSMSKHN